MPITTPLRSAMASWERRPGPYLVRPDGKPWAGEDLTLAWTWERDHNPHLFPLRSVTVEGMTKPLVLHGLRGTACVRLRRSGASTLEISSMVGMSARMVERYCRFSAQKENAAAAIIRLERTLQERKSDIFKSNGK